MTEVVNGNSFQTKLKTNLEEYLLVQERIFPQEDLLKIDLHCHDYNSDEPDELLGRILKLPETWLTSEELLNELKRNNCDTFTITNHNNARSCYLLQEQGIDIITAAEFSCWVPDFSIGIHVLTFGFSPDQEKTLNKLRKNIYLFQEYTRKHNIPTIWAHPLYHYSIKEMPPIHFFNKMLLIFERFEVLNGQRDAWQNLLVKEWLDQITPEDIDLFSKKYNIDPSIYCSNPYKKSYTGGSDSHMGLFAGMTGSFLYVPNLQERIKTEKKSSLALEALRNGNIVPFGSHQNTEKLTIAFLDYTCQAASNYSDPGLVRMFLHKGDFKDKLTSLIIGNIFNEVQKHKVTMSFMKLFHNCLMGEKPSFLKKLVLPSVYKPIFDDASKIAKYHKKNKPNLVDKYYNSIVSINDQLNKILFHRLEKKIDKVKSKNLLDSESIISYIEKLELPSNVRNYLTGENRNGEIDIAKFLDGLSFPFFASLFILAAHFASSKSMYHTRPFLKTFSNQINRLKHPEKVLWMTDTFDEKNGVSIFLRQLLTEIRKYNLPIDILVCSDTLKSEDHLVVLKPVAEFEIPFYESQKVSVPNFLELHNIFLKGEYDRIVSSTEGIMGLGALFLKHSYEVKASFFLHTDWLNFAKSVLKIKGSNLHRVERMLRGYYKSFDKIFVLNGDQKNWLNSSKMDLKEEMVVQTAHWTHDFFIPKESQKKNLWGFEDSTPVILYVGRLSEEKGVLELPYIYRNIKKEIPQVKLVIIGSGPSLKTLQNECSEAYFSSWVDQENLPNIYSSANILILPSWFDTFCNVVLESLSCGLPVIAYNSKGPKEIINNGECGFLVKSRDEMSQRATQYLTDETIHDKFKLAAIERSKEYSSRKILKELLFNLELNDVSID